MEVPVLYGGDAGPDLADSARRLGLSSEELIRRHCAREYLVHMIGFTPGFPYLGTLDPSISLPRLETPRTSVPQGSVGIAREQTGIYSIPAPGGWRIIGRTPLKVFSPDRDKPFLFEPGMRVKFRPITSQEFARLAEQDREHDRPHRREEEREQERQEVGKPAESAILSCPIGRRDSPVKNAVPALMVQSPGFFSTVQDLGRRGFRKYGVPLSGAADPVSLVRGNLLVGNQPGAAGIEMTYSGAAFMALLDVPVAVTGAPAEVTIDGHPVKMWTPLLLRKSSVLEIGAVSTGARTYLTVAGGIQTPTSLGKVNVCQGLAGRGLRPSAPGRRRPGSWSSPGLAVAWFEGHRLPRTFPRRRPGSPGEDPTRTRTCGIRNRSSCNCGTRGTDLVQRAVWNSTTGCPAQRRDPGEAHLFLLPRQLVFGQDGFEA